MQGHLPLLREEFLMHSVSNLIFYSLFINCALTNAPALFISILCIILLSLRYILFITLKRCLYFLLFLAVVFQCEALCYVCSTKGNKNLDDDWGAWSSVQNTIPTCSGLTQCCNFQNHRTNNWHWICTCSVSLLHYCTLMQSFGWRKGKTLGGV